MLSLMTCTETHGTLQIDSDGNRKHGQCRQARRRAGRLLLHAHAGPQSVQPTEPPGPV